MLSLGCVSALNLDGGGSSALWVRGVDGVVNRPSDGTERAVANAVVVLAKDVVATSAPGPWKPRIEFAGEYELLARGPPGLKGRVRVGDRATDVEGKGDGWASLGRFRLEEGLGGCTVDVPGATALKWVQRN
jgi:hypothetical protein